MSGGQKNRIVQPRVLKGFRDYLPEAEIPRQAMLRKVVQVFESFGFGPLTTPALEYSEILLGKYGEEGDKLLYRFKDNGDRDIALRYDLTVPLARVVGQHRSLEVPFKRYQIAPVWRAEKPGRGRFREFQQCDVDIVGEPSIRADAECLSVGLEVLTALGVPGFVARVNNRKILDALLDGLGLETAEQGGSERRHAVLRAVDKLPKIGRQGVSKELSEGVGIGAAEQERLFAFLEREIASPDDVRGLVDLLGEGEAATKGIGELVSLLEMMADAGYGDAVEVDLSIARGLDYYTGTIYETFVRGREGFGSVMSGGRYDTLLGMFLKQSIPAVGISLGIDRLVAVLDDLGLVERRTVTADAFMVLFDDGSHGAVQALARQLRRDGVGVEVSLRAGKLGKQFKYAERKGYRWVLIAGPDELAAGEVKVKDLQSGDQQTVDSGDVATALRAGAEPHPGHR